MNFYHAANASKAVKLSSGKRVTFDVYSFFAGAWLGIAAVEDQETIDGLDELTRKARSGISRITEEDYRGYLKKKALPQSLRPLHASVFPPPIPQVPLALVDGRAGRLVEKAVNKDNLPEVAADAPAKVYDSIDEVLKVGVIKTVNLDPPPKSRGAGEKVSRSSAFAKRPRYEPETEQA